jgi:hypothetical protein
MKLRNVLNDDSALSKLGDAVYIDEFVTEVELYTLEDNHSRFVDIQ